MPPFCKFRNISLGCLWYESFQNEFVAVAASDQNVHFGPKSDRALHKYHLKRAGHRLFWYTTGKVGLVGLTYFPSTNVFTELLFQYENVLANVNRNE